MKMRKLSKAERKELYRAQCSYYVNPDTSVDDKERIPAVEIAGTAPSVVAIFNQKAALPPVRPASLIIRARDHCLFHFPKVFTRYTYAKTNHPVGRLTRTTQRYLLYRLGAPR